LLVDHPRLSARLRRLIPPFDKAADYRGWPVSVISEDTSPEARRAALETGPWGRCVYRCDNDVVDHQAVNLEMESGITCTLAMQGHSHLEGRTMRYDGSRATVLGLYAAGVNDSIEIHDHRTGRVEVIRFPTRAGGHGGGDDRLMASFVRNLRSGEPPLTSAAASLESHLMAFAAEQARIEGAVVDMTAFRQRATGA
jgi:predicted dehydrogenase